MYYKWIIDDIFKSLKSKELQKLEKKLKNFILSSLFIKDIGSNSHSSPSMKYLFHWIHTKLLKPYVRFCAGTNLA